MSVRQAVAEVEAEKQVTPEKTVLTLIEAQKGQIARALPKTMSEDRFARILVTEVRANPMLLRCEPLSMMAAVMKAAALGVEPGPLGHVYLVPFRNGKTGRYEVQFILGYKGIIDLARRSGKIQSLYTDVVYEGDAFDYKLGLRRDLNHERTPDSNREKVTHAYAVVWYTDGGFDFEVLDEFEINARRMRSKAKDSGPWVTDFNAMARKSAVKALSSRLPLTIEVAEALDSDQRSYDLSDLGDIVDVPQPPAVDAPQADAISAGSPSDDEHGQPVASETSDPASSGPHEEAPAESSQKAKKA